MDTACRRLAPFLAILLCAALLGGCAARGPAGPGPAAIQSGPGESITSEVAAAQAPDPQSPYSIPF